MTDPNLPLDHQGQFDPGGDFLAGPFEEDEFEDEEFDEDVDLTDIE